MKKRLIMAFGSGTMLGFVLFAPSQPLFTSVLTSNKNMQPQYEKLAAPSESRLDQYAQAKAKQDPRYRRYSNRGVGRFSTKEFEYVTSSNRKSKFKSSAPKTPTQPKQLLPNYRYSQRDTRDAFGTKTQAVNAKPSRVSTESLRGWKKPLRPGSVVLKRIAQSRGVFRTYENDLFSVQVPKFLDSEATENGHHFAKKNSDFTVSVKRLEENCQGKGFYACAIHLSRNENHSGIADKIISATKTSRRSVVSRDIIKGQEVKTFTEAFEAFVGGEQRYIVRYFVKVADDEIYLIETQSDALNSARYLDISKRILDSFRVFDGLEGVRSS